MAMDAIAPGSRIGRLPKIAKPVALKLRSLARGFRAFEAATHESDGVLTPHNMSFAEQPDFKTAHARAVKAAGADYEIPFRVHQALWCAASAPPGCFVELGTARGFIMSAVLSQHPERETHLFDSFLPNRPSASGAQDGPTSHFYATSSEDVEANFSEWPNVSLHKGDIFQTLPSAALPPVAFLHIDLNHPKVETFGLKALWPSLARGAIILWDDYAFAGHEPQYEAINAVTSELGLSVLTTATGQGIAVKG